MARRAEINCGPSIQATELSLGPVNFADLSEFHAFVANTAKAMAVRQAANHLARSTGGDDGRGNS